MTGLRISLHFQDFKVNLEGISQSCWVYKPRDSQNCNEDDIWYLVGRVEIYADVVGAGNITIWTIQKCGFLPVMVQVVIKKCRTSGLRPQIEDWTFYHNIL